MAAWGVGFSHCGQVTHNQCDSWVSSEVKDPCVFLFCTCRSHLGFFFNTYFHLFGCTGMWDLVSRPGIEPGPLHRELGILATGPPGKFQFHLGLKGKKSYLFYRKVIFKSISCPPCHHPAGGCDARRFLGITLWFVKRCCL